MPTTSSSSASSVTSESSSTQLRTSSSSFVEHAVFAGKPSYVSDCTSMESVLSPLAGKEAGMTVLGHFDVAPTAYSPIGPEIPQLLNIGGLSKTEANRGAFFCANAGNLFSMDKGEVSLRLSLPHDIVGGVYRPLIGSQPVHLPDYVIWGVSLGEEYFCKPGMYAAFTPLGIEFSVWSSRGLYTILDTTTSYYAGDDIILKFLWNRSPSRIGHDATMAIMMNGLLTAWARHPMGDDPLSDLYFITGGALGTQPKHAEFQALDCPGAKAGLQCTVRRVEIYRFMAPADVHSSSFTSSTSSGTDESSSVVGGRDIAAGAPLQFTFIGSGGHNISVTDVGFSTVVRKVISLNSDGPVGAARDSGGIDSGALVGPGALPTTPLDMPPGFEEVLDLS